MYCRACGKELVDTAEVCIQCGSRPLAGNKFCPGCGTENVPTAEFCIKCGRRFSAGSEQKDWLATLLFSVFLGGLGIDRFYLGYTTLGILKLCTGGGCGIWWLIDLILIVTGDMKDAEGRPLKKSF